MFTTFLYTESHFTNLLHKHTIFETNFKNELFGYICLLHKHASCYTHLRELHLATVNSSNAHIIAHVSSKYHEIATNYVFFFS